MSDFASSLPVRTENNGDVVVNISDATTPSQKTAVDTHGSLSVLLRDAAGTAISSSTINSLDRLNVYLSSEGVAGAVNPFSTVQVGGSDGTDLRALLTDATGKLIVVANNFPATVDTNYGTVGASTLRSAAQIGNATGAADFNFGAASGQTLRVAALIGNAAGVVDYNFGTIGAQSIRSAAQIGNATGAADFNFGAIGAQSLRAAAQVGNATGAADFNNGTTTAQTLRVAANLAVGGANVSASNPVPVVLEDNPGTHINDYKDAASIAAGSSDDHDYTVTAGKTLHLNQVEAASSGKAKMIVRVETGVGTGTFNDVFAKFNSTADPNISLIIQDDILVAAGVRVRVTMFNYDKAAQDLYSTISGYEL